MDEDTLKKDMEELAKMVFDLSEKHGGIYVSAARSKGFGISWANYQKDGKEIKSVNYFGENQV